MGGEDGLAIGGEQHEIGFPMSGAGSRSVGALGQGNAAGNGFGGRAAAPAAPAAAGFGAGQVMAPGIVVGSPDLGIDEAIDALVADHPMAGIARHAAGDLFGGPARTKAGEHVLTQIGLALEPWGLSEILCARP